MSHLLLKLLSSLERKMKELKLRHYYGAGMILYTKDGNDGISVLLEKRSDNHTWAIPGGAIEEWEKYIKAAQRETYEETGIKIESAWPVMNYHLPYFSYYVFASELSHKTVPRKNWESDAIEWFSIEDLPEGMNWMTRIEIKDFIRKEKKHVE